MGQSCWLESSCCSMMTIDIDLCVDHGAVMFTFNASAVRRCLWSLLTDPTYFPALACLVIAGDAILTQLIVRFVPCQRTVHFQCSRKI